MPLPVATPVQLLHGRCWRWPCLSYGGSPRRSSRRPRMVISVCALGGIHIRTQGEFCDEEY